MANPQTGADAETAERIIATMSDKSISLLALSNETGIAYPTLRRSIKAGRSLKINEIGRIADALNVHPSTLLPEAITGTAA
jgi:lambda repressor-like predicted transcriptional regulator